MKLESFSIVQENERNLDFSIRASAKICTVDYSTLARRQHSRALQRDLGQKAMHSQQ